MAFAFYSVGRMRLRARLWLRAAPLPVPLLPVLLPVTRAMPGKVR